MNRERIEQAHVIGSSLGGMIAQHFVRRYPERVRSLVLSHTAAPESNQLLVGAVRAAALHAGRSSVVARTRDDSGRDEDPLMPAATQIALRKLYPTAQVHRFSQCGHSVSILDPEQFVRVIRQFISQPAQ